MWTQIILAVVGIHLLELIIVAFYLLVTKVNKQQRIIEQQQKYLEAISITINNMDEELKQIDQRGTFSSDDEVGFFFERLKGMQELLNNFKIN